MTRISISTSVALLAISLTGCVEENADLVRFFRALTHFRRDELTVRRKHFLSGIAKTDDELPDVSWFNALGVAVDWSGVDTALICLLTPCGGGVNGGREVMMLANPTSIGREFMLPAVAKGLQWRLFFDTAAAPPYDIYPAVDGPAPVSGTLALTERSMRCYVAPS